MGYVRRVFSLSLGLIIFGGHPAYLGYCVHNNGHKQLYLVTTKLLQGVKITV